MKKSKKRAISKTGRKLKQTKKKVKKTRSNRKKNSIKKIKNKIKKKPGYTHLFSLESRLNNRNNIIIQIIYDTFSI